MESADPPQQPERRCGSVERGTPLVRSIQHRHSRSSNGLRSHESTAGRETSRAAAELSVAGGLEPGTFGLWPRPNRLKPAPGECLAPPRFVQTPVGAATEPSRSICGVTGWP